MSVVAPDGIARLVQISSVLLPHNAVRGRMTAHGDISIDTFKAVSYTHLTLPTILLV